MGSRRRDSVITYYCARVGLARWLNLSSTRTWPPAAKQLGAPGVRAEVGFAGILGYSLVLLRRHANGYLFCHLPGLSAGPFRLLDMDLAFLTAAVIEQARHASLCKPRGLPSMACKRKYIHYKPNLNR
jgi:hypothetical protein